MQSLSLAPVLVLGIVACPAPYLPPAITPQEVAILGCYHLSLDRVLIDSTFPTAVLVRLDSSHTLYGRLMVPAPPPVSGGVMFWKLGPEFAKLGRDSFPLLGPDSLLLRFGVGVEGQGIEVRLGSAGDRWEGMAIEYLYPGTVATTPWFSQAHAMRVACPSS